MRLLIFDEKKEAEPTVYVDIGRTGGAVYLILVDEKGVPVKAGTLFELRITDGKIHGGKCSLIGYNLRDLIACDGDGRILD